MQIYMFRSASYTFIYYRVYVYDIVCTIQNLDDVGPNEYNPELHI